jgi:tetratricopeptide (TPR) repeat protein
LGQPDEALRLLRTQLETIAGKGPKLSRARLRYSYADHLESSEQLEEAEKWFAAAVKLDPDATTDAAERLAALQGVVITVDEDELEGDDEFEDGESENEGGDSGSEAGMTRLDESEIEGGDSAPHQVRGDEAGMTEWDESDDDTDFVSEEEPESVDDVELVSEVEAEPTEAETAEVAVVVEAAEDAEVALEEPKKKPKSKRKLNEPKAG